MQEKLHLWAFFASCARKVNDIGDAVDHALVMLSLPQHLRLEKTYLDHSSALSKVEIVFECIIDVF